MKQAKINTTTTNVSTIPDTALEALARCLLPAIRSYFESEEGQHEFAEWKAEQQLREEQLRQERQEQQLRHEEQEHQLLQECKHPQSHQQQQRKGIENLPSREVESGDMLRLAG